MKEIMQEAVRQEEEMNQIIKLERKLIDATNRTGWNNKPHQKNTIGTQTSISNHVSADTQTTFIDKV